MFKNSVLFFEKFYDSLVDMGRYWIFLPTKLGVTKHQINKQRTGSVFLDRVNLILFHLQNLYIFIARHTIYRKTPICAKEVWVRSGYEKRFANYLTDNGYKFQYEKSMIFPRRHNTILPNIYILRWIAKLFCKNWKDAITLHPDFYLTDEKIFVEVWGMTHDWKYRNIMKAKRRLYERDNLPLVDLYPEDISTLKVLKGVFPKKLHKLKSRKKEGLWNIW